MPLNSLAAVATGRAFMKKLCKTKMLAGLQAHELAEKHEHACPYLHTDFPWCCRLSTDLKSTSADRGTKDSEEEVKKLPSKLS